MTFVIVTVLLHLAAERRNKILYGVDKNKRTNACMWAVSKICIHREWQLRQQLSAQIFLEIDFVGTFDVDCI